MAREFPGPPGAPSLPDPGNIIDAIADLPGNLVAAPFRIGKHLSKNMEEIGAEVQAAIQSSTEEKDTPFPSNFPNAILGSAKSVLLHGTIGTLAGIADGVKETADIVKARGDRLVGR